MKPASPEQAVFAEACQLATPEARAVYLEAACGADTTLHRRVEAEQQALALMDHPNIAKVRDGGATPTEAGGKP